MGIKKLFTFLNNNKLYECYPYLNNIYDEYNLDKNMSLVGVDANLFCYKYMHSYDNMLIGFFNQILKFLSNKIIPLYIFDGGVLPEKEFTNNQRNNKKLYNKLKLEILNDMLLDRDYNINEILELKNKFEKNSIKISNDSITILIELLDLLNIPYVFSFTEGDFLGVLLNKYKIIDFFLTDDTDPIPGGINNIIKFYNNNVYYLDTLKINSKLNLTINEFCDFCIILGNDYKSFNHGLKPKEVYDLIKKYNNIENIIKNETIKNLDESCLEIINKIRNIYKLGYLKERNNFLGKKNDELFKYDNIQKLSNIFIEIWDEFIEILKLDLDKDNNNILKKSNNLKNILNVFIKNKKFNINKILKFINKNIPDTTNDEIKNIKNTFEYLNNILN